jgi:hypothetical protein
VTAGPRSASRPELQPPHARRVAAASRRTWRPLSDVHIQIRTAAAWRAANRSPLLRTLVDLLPPATEPGSDDAGAPRPVRSRPER